MLMIIAPSKTQECDNSFSSDTTRPLLLQDSTQLMDELRGYSVADLGKLMKMSERLAQQTRQRIERYSTPFTTKNACPAIATFQGDVYSRINIEKYGKKEIEYLQNHLCILSGLYGILRPLDLMQPYRLEMGCRLKNSRGGNLYEFWGEKISSEVNRILDDHEERVLVNLASTEYSRVIKKKHLHGSMLQIDFKERKGDDYRTVAIHAKRARGMMVNFAVRNGLQQGTDLRDFQQEGYVFRPELSTEEHYCFTRDQ